MPFGFGPQGTGGYGLQSETAFWKAFHVALIPTSITSSAGTVTGWTNVGSLGGTCTATGSPAVDSSQTFGPGVAFDGSNDRLDLTLPTAIADDSICTVWILHKPDSVTAGGRSGILEVGKTGAGNESLWVHTSFGSIVARYRADDLGDASATTAMQITRVDATRFSRSIYRNGALKNCSGKNVAPGREVTKIRLGNRLASDVSYYDGSIFAVLIRWGAVTEAEALAIDDKLRGWAGIAAAFRYSDIPAATSTTGDPRCLLPATLHTLVGYPLTIDEYSLGYRDGRVTRTFASDLPMNRIPAGRVVVTPPAAGTYSFTVREGAYTTTTQIVAHAVPVSLASNVVLLPCGNSQAHRGQEGALEYLTTLFGASFTTVGSIAAPSGYSCRAEGRDSWVMSTAAIQGTAKGAFNGTGGSEGPSPLFNGGVLDIANYRTTQLGGVAPTDVWLSCFQNGPYLASLSTIEAILDAEMTATAAVFQAMAADFGSTCRFRVFNEYPLAADPSLWANWAASSEYHLKAYRAAEVVNSIPDDPRFAGLNIEVVPTFCLTGPGTAPRSGWIDPVHVSAGPGHERLLPVLAAQLVKDAAS